MIAEKIKEVLMVALKNLGIEADEIILEHPADLANGDYSTNIALVLAKQLKEKPLDIARKIICEIQNLTEVERVEVAGVGFINFYLPPKFFVESIEEILKVGNEFGKNKKLANKKVMHNLISLLLDQEFGATVEERGHGGL